VVAPAPDGGNTNENSVINEGLVLGQRIHAERAARHGVSAWVDGPRKRTSDVDVDDVARFYLLAAQAAPAGALYNCSGETDISIEELAQAVGTAMGVPARALPRAEVQARTCGAAARGPNRPHLVGPTIAFCSLPTFARAARRRKPIPCPGLALSAEPRD